MKIGARQFHFPEPALLVALDGQKGRVFFAHDGRVVQRAFLEVKPKKIDERKPLVRRAGRGRLLATGAPSDEHAKDEAFARLVRQVNAAARRELENGATELYLFAPKHLTGKTQRHLVPVLRRALKHVFPVDVVHDHPRVLVERVTAEFRP